MLGFLKKKKREEMDDFFDIKNTITGRVPERDVIEPARPDPFRPAERQDEWIPPFPRKDVAFEELPRGGPFDRASGKDYDVMQRLDVIESQLQAIRSQTETINERLKNLEFRITGGRRY